MTRISVYLPADALDKLDGKADWLSARLTAVGVTPHKVTRSDVIRLAVDAYLKGKK